MSGEQISRYYNEAVIQIANCGNVLKWYVFLNHNCDPTGFARKSGLEYLPYPVTLSRLHSDGVIGVSWKNNRPADKDLR